MYYDFGENLDVEFKEESILWTLAFRLNSFLIVSTIVFAVT